MIDARSWLPYPGDEPGEHTVVGTVKILRGVLVMGPPVEVERMAPLEALPSIEAALTAACDTADGWVAAQAGVAAEARRGR